MYNLLVPVHILVNRLPKSGEVTLTEEDTWLTEKLSDKSELKDFLIRKLETEEIHLTCWNKKQIISLWINELSVVNHVIQLFKDECAIKGSIVNKRLNDTDELALVFKLDSSTKIEEYNLIMAKSIKCTKTYNY